jgi:SnoaL-like domain
VHRAEHLTVTRIAGDSPPRAVAELYELAGRGEADEAARRFTAAGVYAFGSDEADERGTREVATGRADIATALRADLAAGVGQILVCVHERRDCLVEGRLVDSVGTHVATFAASFTLDTDDSILRAVTYRTTPVQPASAWSEQPVAAAADARRALERYFSQLEGGDFDRAARCFSEDVLYAYPQAEPGLPRPVYVGRAALLEAFVARGRQPWRHRVLTWVQRGRNCIAEGDVLELAPGRTGGWISSLTLDAEGMIARYCAFYAEPAAPRWSTPAGAVSNAYDELK